MSKTKRYLIVMLLSVLMNQGFYILASDNGLDLPFWLDFTGTAFAAIVLEPLSIIFIWPLLWETPETSSILQ